MPDLATEWTDGALAEHLRDPSTSTGMFPQEIRDQVAAELEKSARLAERWST